MPEPSEFFFSDVSVVTRSGDSPLVDAGRPVRISEKPRECVEVVHAVREGRKPPIWLISSAGSYLNAEMSVGSLWSVYIAVEILWHVPTSPETCALILGR